MFDFGIDKDSRLIDALTRIWSAQTRYKFRFSLHTKEHKLPNIPNIDSINVENLTKLSNETKKLMIKEIMTLSGLVCH